jgi:hypothetical protein
MRLVVDPWDPSYLSPDTDSLESSRPEVIVDTEYPAGAWAPVPGRADDAPSEVVVVDGVRRIEARVWVDDGGPPVVGVCASWAAGAVRCARGLAELVTAEVARGLVAPAPGPLPRLRTAVGEFVFHPAPAAGAEAASIVVQDRMAELEALVSAAAVQAASPGALVVLDGPLRDRVWLPGAMGLVKTHRVAYLERAQADVLARLTPGRRTPVFTIVGRMPRHSWYVRLPGPPGGPMAGVVRIECAAGEPADAVALADRSVDALGRLASVPHKDPRAPQNLTPIAGLERLLRHRLGDPRLVRRALQRAAAGEVPPAQPRS